MNSKSLIRIVIFGALLVVLGLCALTGYGTVAWLTRNIPNADVWGNASQSAQVTETLTFDAYSKLEISADFSDIQVTAADVDGIEVQMIKTAWGTTVEEAEARAEAIAVSVIKGTDLLTIDYEDRSEDFALGWQREPDSIDFFVRVPAETSVDLQTSFGKISISGLVGNAVLDTDFGDLDIENLTGPLDAKSNNASITVNQVEAGDGRVSVENQFGDVTVENVSAAEVTISTSNGTINVDSVTAQGTIRIENEFGAIDVEDVHGETLEIDDHNGSILVDGGQMAELISAGNIFGDVTITNLESPAYQLSTSNGKLSVDGAGGSLELRNNFGDISIANASNVTLDVSSSNGTISFSGSLAAAAHRIENTFGDITLTIPEDSAFNVVLETAFGNITSEIPLSLAGTLESDSENDHWEASLNEGGPVLEVTTSNGDIVIRALPSGE